MFKSSTSNWHEGYNVWRHTVPTDNLYSKNKLRKCNLQIEVNNIGNLVEYYYISFVHTLAKIYGSWFNHFGVIEKQDNSDRLIFIMMVKGIFDLLEFLKLYLEIWGKKTTLTIGKTAFINLHKCAKTAHLGPSVCSRSIAW